MLLVDLTFPAELVAKFLIIGFILSTCAVDSKLMGSLFIGLNYLYR